MTIVDFGGAEPGPRRRRRQRCKRQQAATSQAEVRKQVDGCGSREGGGAGSRKNLWGLERWSGVLAAQQWAEVDVRAMRESVRGRAAGGGERRLADVRGRLELDCGWRRKAVVGGRKNVGC